MYELLIATLATYGVATLIAEYDGPRDIFRKLRRKGKVFECSTCLSVYIAVIPVLILSMSFLEYIAIIGAVIIIERIT